MPYPYEEPEAGKTKFFDRIALYSAITALICVFAAHSIDHWTNPANQQDQARAHGQAGIDYSTTASIGKDTRNITLNPCGNR